ncbi:cytochrome P450 [Streptomyces sp. NPDC050625]|uniref:cytochrome P450 n=1 Tax=Streptomyces sp. NPDC050625 TaxID=3154629 RepID=UPI003449B644
MRIDLQEPGLWRADGSPYEQFAWLRENDPVHWHRERGEGPGYWALTRYADIKALETDSETWSSAGSTLIEDYEPVGRDGYRLLINSDPPAHTVRRRFVGQELTPIAVKSQAAHVEDVVTDVLDEVIERGECDLVPDISGRLASFVIADLLGIPRKDALELFFAAEILVRGFSVHESPGLEAAQTVARFGAELWADRSRNHTPDVLGRLAHGEVDGKPMDEEQFTLDFFHLITAGSDTSRNVVSTGMMALFAHTAQHQKLIDDPSLVPGAVEEMLRWNPPIVYQRRTATKDTVLGGQEMPKGAKAAGYYGAGNRDPRVFENPETFDVTRRHNPHLTFGAGRHFCLGSHLARLELVTMFTGLVTRLPDLEPTGPAVWHPLEHAPTVVGPASLPVRFTPGRKVGVAAR